MSSAQKTTQACMTIEQFVAQSEGKWRSMRSGHSLAFQQFEEVLSEVTIEEISREDSAIKQLIESPLAKRFNLMQFHLHSKWNGAQKVTGNQMTHQKYHQAIALLFHLSKTFLRGR